MGKDLGTLALPPGPSQEIALRDKSPAKRVTKKRLEKGLYPWFDPKKNIFVSIHTHTTFSYGDGFGTVEEHVARNVELGNWALFFTEHGNNSSHAQLEKMCRKYGNQIKPGYGCELYTAPTDPDTQQLMKTRKKFHQTVVARNGEGYRNLNHLVSNSWANGYFQWPTVSSAEIIKHRKGLVVLSGCSDSALSCTLLGGKSTGEKRDDYDEEDFQNARRLIEMNQQLFGEYYFLEVQRFPGLARTCVLNPALAELSKVTGARLAATADVHYPFPHQNKMQTVLHAAHRGSTVDKTEASWEYDILLSYPLSDAEIHDDLMQTGLTDQEAWGAIVNTSVIANECKVELPKNEPIRFPYPGSMLRGEEKTRAWAVEKLDADGYVHEYSSIKEYLWEKLREGWRFRAKTNKFMRKNKKKYAKRLNYEMGQIEDKDFPDYFAMVSDSVVWAKEHKIPVGPARGSAAASLACYLLRITEIDPMQFPHMLFARFIDPNRLDLPDIDLDFADDRRHEVREYLVSVYGADRVGNIGNFTRYKGKNSIDDVARVYKIPSWAASTVKELIVERSGGDARQSDSLADTFAMFPKAQKILDQFPKLGIAMELEGNYRGMSVHAAGLVISNTPIADTCALYTRPKKAGDDEITEGDSVTVIAYDKKDSEYVGMLKMDYLGLKTMGLVGIALDYIGMDLEDLYRIPITEEKTLAAFTRNDLAGIFQFDGRATAIVNRDVYPTNFGHLADINALSRPGPLFSGMTAQYQNVKHGREPRELLHPVVDELTSWTYGQIVYQEQVLSIVKDLAGFPIERVGDIRKIISQKLGNMAMANALEEFIEGCWKTHQVKPELARKIWNFIATSSTYSFNQSHSVSYAMLAFWCMYLKVYHPKEFYAAALAKIGDGKDVLWKRAKIIRDAESHGLKVQPPSLVSSRSSWSPTKDGIRGGFLQVSGIGPATTKSILEWRNTKRALGIKPVWDDLSEVKGIGPATVKKVEDFVNSSDPYGIRRVGQILEGARAALKGSGLPLPTHHSTAMPQLGTHNVVWIGMARNLNYKDVVEATRTRTGLEEEEILADLNDPELRKSCVIQAYDEGEEDVYIRVSRYKFPGLEAELQDLVKDQDVVLVVGRKREDFGISIHVTDMWIMKMEEEEDDGSSTLELEPVPC